MISDAQRDAYQRDGFIVVPDLLGPAQLARLRRIIAELVAGAAAVDTHTAVYDLEPGHTRAEPKVRRIKTPHEVHPAFYDVVRNPDVIAVLTALIGPDLRLHSSKLNMKSARYGSPVEWHQDWAFYPHTNDDILAIGVMLDDVDLENGPLLVTPGTHKGPVWNHHGEDGRFCGLTDPADIANEIANAVPLTGRAGSMSFHHVRALHGSALNTSDRSRNLLLYGIAAADAWPLLGVPDLDEFNSRMLSGKPSVEPRLVPVPVRLPLPPAARQGSIYENQAEANRSYFKKAVVR
ncbi:MAG: phytanoyl-CoA dioxygenase family protein [Candidatus Rokubacteria bacterium]|nr:phytanoyl-CoA dioxygenase family protein [Candidatus Rokubacteria bacterium]